MIDIQLYFELQSPAFAKRPQQSSRGPNIRATASVTRSHSIRQKIVIDENRITKLYSSGSFPTM